MKTVMTKSEMMQKVKDNEMIELFTHVTEGVFNVSATRGIAKDVGVLIDLAVDAHLVKHVVEERDYSMRRVAEITTEQAKDPILVLLCEDKTKLLIDGSHRILRAMKDRKATIAAYLLPIGDAIRSSTPPDTRGAYEWGTFNIVNGKVIPHGAN